jgi:aspartate/methionine/tyrosine aminotransferase
LNHIPLSLKDDKLQFSVDDLKKAINPKVKILLLNSPQNPTAKVFTLEELDQIRSIVLASPQLTVIADEVYFRLTYTGLEFSSFALLPDMFSRTITVYSVGKTFSGNIDKKYKYGYAVGTANSFEPYGRYLKTQGASPIKLSACCNLVALLSSAKKPYQNCDSFYAWNKLRFVGNWKRIEAALKRLGFKVVAPEGGYYCMVDIKPAVAGRLPVSYFYESNRTDVGAKVLTSFEEWELLDGAERTPDFAFSLFLAEVYGLVFWPVSAFSDYQKTHTPLKDRACIDLLRVSLARDDALIKKLETFADNNLNLFA